MNVGGIQLSIVLFLQRSDTCVPVVFIGVLGAVRRDDVGGGENLCGVNLPYHKE